MPWLIPGTWVGQAVRTNGNWHEELAQTGTDAEREREREERAMGGEGEEEEKNRQRLLSSARRWVSRVALFMYTHCTCTQHTQTVT